MESPGRSAREIHTPPQLCQREGLCIKPAIEQRGREHLENVFEAHLEGVKALLDGKPAEPKQKKMEM